MKIFVGLLAVLYLLCFPIRLSVAQSDSVTLSHEPVEWSKGANKVAVIKAEICNNLDSIKALVKKKSTPATHIVVRKKYYRHVVRDTLYIDTCIAKTNTKYIFQRITIPDSSTKIQPAKKLNWFQKIFKHQPKNKKSSSL